MFAADDSYEALPTLDRCGIDWLLILCLGLGVVLSFDHLWIRRRN